MLFVIMKKQNHSNTWLLGLLLLMILISCCNPEQPDTLNAERVKVALRSVGNQLLLLDQDTTSLVLPVIDLGANKFEIAFEKPLSFDPVDLQTLVSENLEKANLPANYLVEVVQCSDREIAYSYVMQRHEQSNIVPCGGRIAPENCYTIQVHFTSIKTNGSGNETLFYVLVFLVLAFLTFVFYSKYHSHRAANKHFNVSSLGSFRFYPDQNKLVKEAQEISLSNKECELLTILAANPNQIVKRDELSKKVWEDNGVIVGRSLDTYISKLRKILQEDNRIKITNVHGVGYKLEIED
jgi:hypothetical protein